MILERPTQAPMNMPTHKLMLNMEPLLLNMHMVPLPMMNMDTRPTQDMYTMPYIIMVTQSITESTDTMLMVTMPSIILLATLNMPSMTLAKLALMHMQTLMAQKAPNGKLLPMLKMAVTGKRLPTLTARFKIMKI